MNAPPRAWWQRLLPGFGHGGFSLERQLLLWVLLPQLVLWLAGGLMAYRFAAVYANEAIDASLAQATRALARQLRPIGSGLFIDFPKAAQDVLEADPADRLLYMVSTPPGQFILGNQALPAPPDTVGTEPRYGQPYFYDGSMPTSPVADEPARAVRVAALYLRLDEPTGEGQVMLVQVARSSTHREVLARQILTDMLLPLSSLILLMTLIVWFGIRVGLAPLGRLRQQVEGRAPTDLAPLQLASAPRELWSLASALNSLLAAVSHNVSAQKRFIGDAAHQLRTPLAGLKSQTELALQAAQEPELRARLEHVHQSATRSAHLVTQLLTLARAEPESALPGERQHTDLRLLAQQVTAECVPRAIKQDMDLGMADGSEAPVWVDINPLLVREAVLNLIDNALRYAGRGSEVTVDVHAEGDQAVLTVADTGPGISEADRERVLERFVRASDQPDGCGLGLSIVKEITERHAGRVELGAVSPHGLRATLHLPLSPAPTHRT